MGWRWFTTKPIHNAWIYDQGMLGMSVSSILRLVGCTMGLQIFQEHTMLMGSVEHLKKYVSLSVQQIQSSQRNPKDYIVPFDLVSRFVFLIQRTNWELSDTAPLTQMLLKQKKPARVPSVWMFEICFLILKTESLQVLIHCT